MKIIRLLFVTFIILLTFNLINVFAQEQKKIKITFNDRQIIVNLENNSLSEQFYNQLPLNLDFEDYSGTEKISYLSQKLIVDNSMDGYDPSVGDLAYYAPWGNICFYYNDFGYSSSLIKLGTISKGAEYLKELETSAYIEKYVEKNEDKKILVAYFSRTGNTEKLAQNFADITGADIFKIVPVNSYPDDYNACLTQVQNEQSEDYKPPLSTKITDYEKYDVIYVGYPIWFSKLPPPINTFLTEYDFSNKIIVPFCTHGGSRLGVSENQIKNICKNSQVLDGFAGKSDTPTEDIKTFTDNIKNNYLNKEQMGDVDLDGYLTSNDAALILKYVLNNDNVNFSQKLKKLSDVSNDGVISSTDAAMVLNKVLNMDYEFLV